MRIMEEVGQRRVRVTPHGVALFNAQCPSSPLDSSRAYCFAFGPGGGLVDCDVPEQEDGPEALALAVACERWVLLGDMPHWAAQGGHQQQH